MATRTAAAARRLPFPAFLANAPSSASVGYVPPAPFAPMQPAGKVERYDLPAPPPAPVHAPSYIDDILGPEGAFARAFPGYEAREGQLQLSRAVDLAITNETELLGQAPTGCHAAGQGILLHDGTVKRVEDVRVGDLLMGPDSKPRTVLALARGEQEMVDVVPVKGTRWRVNRDHILTLVRTNEGLTNGRSGRLSGQVLDVGVPKVLGWSKNQKHIHKLFRVAVEFPNRELPSRIDPYFLGVLLGDGHLSQPDRVSVTNIDRELIAELHQRAPLFGVTLRRVRDAYAFRGRVGNKRHALFAELRKLGLFPIACENRFIPHAYKVQDRVARLELLAGLIDTDGSRSENSRGCFDYVSKSKRLAEDVAFVARSVGLAAYVKQTSKGCPGMLEPGTYFRVCISGNTSIVPCRIARKQAPVREQKKDVLRTGFELCPTGKTEPYFGFTLDGDGRYLLDDFTVTHNTGKSIAYLLPAIRNAVANGKKVIVVTANIALQEQLVGKDLPLLRELLPWPFTWALAKGRGNYLCKDRFEEEQLIQLRTSSTEADQWRQVQDWAPLTDTGDLSELPFEPLPAVRSRFTTSTDDCHGKSCASYNECFALKARRTYQAAEIVVTNYHLFFTEMVIRKETGDAVLLPDWAVAIFDEAHKAPDIAREFFGFKATAGSVRHGARLLAPKNDKTPTINEYLKAQIDQAAEDFFDRLRVYAQSPEYKARLTKPGAVDCSELVSLLGEACAEYERVACSDVGEEVRGKLRRAQRRCGILQHNIGAACEVWKPERFCYFVEEDQKGRVSLQSKLIQVADALREDLFGQPGKSVVMVSATLTTGGSFDFMASEFGCDHATQIEVESPFDFKTNALLVVPRDMPDPTDKRIPREAYTQACAARFVDAVFAAEGRTLGLFTSFRALDEAHRQLLASGWQGRILRHGDAPRTRLIREFKEDVRSVLLGTSSFWEGVDIPGESLSCVVIDRLPFPTPDDPVLDAVSVMNPNSFFEWSIPRAVLALTQGFGRLIRTRTDRGVVVCLDRRICDKPYGRQFRNSLPFTLRISRDFADVARFLGTGAAS